MAPRALVTGSAGFIGYHLCEALLAEGWQVAGIDDLNPYYDPALKAARHDRLARHRGFCAHLGSIANAGTVAAAADRAAPEVIVHLAAQAGVRYSIDNPRAYLDANVTGSFNVMEAARAHGVRHLLMASTSSVYGAGTDMPYAETQKADTQMSFYAATKKAGEAMAHAWAHIHGVPVTMFRFFTVYGPWGRPDMAYFKFTRAILEGRPIDVYNHGRMRRDFTYVGDLVRAVRLLIDVPPLGPDARGQTAPGASAAPGSSPAPGAVAPGDSLSPVAPWRVVNIGNSRSVPLEDFIAALEAALGRLAQRRYMDMQPGDVPATWADASLLRHLTGYAPRTPLAEGVAAFVDWYRAYHAIDADGTTDSTAGGSATGGTGSVS